MEQIKMEKIQEDLPQQVEKTKQEGAPVKEGTFIGESGVAKPKLESYKTEEKLGLTGEQQKQHIRENLLSSYKAEGAEEKNKENSFTSTEKLAEKVWGNWGNKFAFATKGSKQKERIITAKDFVEKIGFNFKDKKEYEFTVFNTTALGYKLYTLFVKNTENKTNEWKEKYKEEIKKQLREILDEGKKDNFKGLLYYNPSTKEYSYKPENKKNNEKTW
jgi:hypothetical protein